MLATQNALPDATIVFDKFHIAKLAGEAVDQVRRAEAKLAAEGDDRLKGTRYSWLRNPLDEDAEQRQEFEPLRKSNLKTARAWAIKETLMDFFRYRQVKRASDSFREWFGWASRSKLRPMVRLAHTLRAASAHCSTIATGRHQRGQRSPELENPVDQIHRPRLPQP